MPKYDIRYYLSVNKHIEQSIIKEAKIEKCSSSFIAKNIIYEKYGYSLLNDYRKEIKKIESMKSGDKFQIKDVIDSNDQMYKTIFGKETLENMECLKIRVFGKRAGVNIFEKI